MSRYSRIAKAVCSTPWLIEQVKFEAILEFVRLKVDGVEPFADYHAASPRTVENKGAIAVLPLYGVISQRMNLMSDFSGGTSTEQFSKSFRAALADPNVSSIVLDIDSPGGTVYGVPELGDEIFAARGAKPIVAVANALAASAAYWLGSAADEFVVTPSGDVGSIGVFAAHVDESGMEEAMGIKTTLISAGKFKVEGNPHEPLTAEAAAAMQARVDDFYSMFTSAVARNRGVKLASVTGGFGQGRVVGAADALKAGMVDRIETLDQTLARLGASGGSQRKKMAAASGMGPEAELELRRRRIRIAAAG